MSVDENVGRLLGYLDESGKARDTIVIYTSDQGFFLGEHGMYDKRFMYEESLRMPLLVRYPRQIAPGSIAESMVLNLDFAPTLLDLAGASIPAEMQGRSFASILRGKTPADWRRSMYYRFYEAQYGAGPHFGVRTDRYKLIHFLYGDFGWELYDLKVDPHEMVNLYDRPDSADVGRTAKGRDGAAAAAIPRPCQQPRPVTERQVAGKAGRNLTLPAS